MIEPPKTVFADRQSLPKSFCHDDRGTALDEAEYLVCALKEIVSAMFAHYGQSSEDRCSEAGFLLVLNLLQDKICIARGELSFPEAREDAPKLGAILAAGADKLAANNPDK